MAHGRRATENQERRQNRINTFGASEGLDGDPGWPDPALVQDHVQQPANWLAVARWAALALYEAWQRTRDEYEAELDRLTKAADARDTSADEGIKEKVLPADQLGRLHLSEVWVPEGIVPRCWCCAAAIVEAGICARCAEIGIKQYRSRRSMRKRRNALRRRRKDRRSLTPSRRWRTLVR